MGPLISIPDNDTNESEHIIGLVEKYFAGTIQFGSTQLHGVFVYFKGNNACP